MAENSGDHPFESNMPPRESSLDDFEKLESFCIQDKSDDDVGNLLGDFPVPKTESNSTSLLNEKDDFQFHKEEPSAPEEPSKGFDVLKDFDSYSYRGSSGNRPLDKLDEQEESLEKYAQKKHLDNFGNEDILLASQPLTEPLKPSPVTIPEVVTQPKIDEEISMQRTPTNSVLPQTTKSTEKKQSDDKKVAATHGKKELPTSTTKSCPFSPSAFFDRTRLNPIVSNLVYWRDLKKSGIVFGVILFFLLSMRFFSLISISAYLTLALLGVTISFRVYKNILQAVQKSNDGHPFKDFLELDIALPEDRAREIADVAVKHLNCVVKKVRGLFLVEDLVDSIKLGIFLWLMTYVGAWFNGLTLVTIAFVVAFTVPKVYETYKVQIDQYLEIACAQVTGALQIVKSKLPFGHKDKQQ